MKQNLLHIISSKACLLLLLLIGGINYTCAQSEKEQLALGNKYLDDFNLEKGVNTLGPLYNTLLLRDEQDYVFLNEVRLSYAMVLEKSNLNEASLLLLQDLEIDPDVPRLVQHEILGQITKARLNEKMGHVVDAHLNLDKAYALLQKTTNKQYLAKYHKRRASLIRVSSQNYDLVHLHIDTALYNASNNNDTLELADIYMVKGIMAGINNNFVQAEAYLDQATLYWRGTTDEHAKLGVLMNRAIFKLRQGEPLLALNFMDSTKYYHPDKYPDMKTGTLSVHARVYETLEMKDSLISTLKALTISIQQDQAKRNTMSIMHLNFKTRKNDLQNELDQKEKEISISKNRVETWYMLFFATLLITAFLLIFLRVSRKNRKEMKRQKTTLENALSDNQILFGEVHHRVKNNISIISSMLQIQQRETTEKKLKETLIETELRIRSIGLVHTLIFNYDQIQKLSIGEYMKKLTNGILETYDMVENTYVTIMSNHLKADINIMVPIGLLMNELITNSVKHAKVENLELSITLHQSNENLKITYQDNGKGFNLDTCSKSFGMEMIQRMTRQIEGEIKISPEGSHLVELIIPYNIS